VRAFSFLLGRCAFVGQDGRASRPTVVAPRGVSRSGDAEQRPTRVSAGVGHDHRIALSAGGVSAAAGPRSRSAKSLSKTNRDPRAVRRVGNVVSPASETLTTNAVFISTTLAVLIKPRISRALRVSSDLFVGSAVAWQSGGHSAGSRAGIGRGSARGDPGQGLLAIVATWPAVGVEDAARSEPRASATPRAQLEQQPLVGRERR